MFSTKLTVGIVFGVLVACIIALPSLQSSFADSVIATIPLSSSPIGITFDPVNGKLYTANSGGSGASVSVIDGSTNTVVSTIPASGSPSQVVFDSINGKIYVTLATSSIIVIDPSTNTLIDSIDVTGGSLGITFDSINGFLYVTGNDHNPVTVIDPSTKTTITTITAGLDPIGITFDSINNEIYVANSFDDTVSVINGDTNTVVATIPVGSEPSALALNPVNNKMYLANGNEFNTNSVQVINASTNTVIDHITTFTNNREIAFDPLNGNMYVTNGQGISVISTSTSADDTDPAVLGSITAPADPVQVNTQVTASASFTDDSDDTHIASWDWGDSTVTTGTVTESAGSGSVQDAHTYSTPGVYTITLTVNNSDGAAATTQFQYVVVFDPNGGFVTGSGWINSPSGAYYTNPSLTGKATFGFNSKYQNGANVPTGNTEFNFKVANLNFHSTSYNWLVIAGAKAQYKGTGTINGVGSYKFMLTAIDGAINGGGGIDKFRIKITDVNDGLVYDNLLNAPDSADPTTVLGGGDIIIHNST